MYESGDLIEIVSALNLDAVDKNSEYVGFASIRQTSPLDKPLAFPFTEQGLAFWEPASPAKLIIAIIEYLMAVSNGDDMCALNLKKCKFKEVRVVRRQFWADVTRRCDHKLFETPSGQSGQSCFGQGEFRRLLVE